MVLFAFQYFEKGFVTLRAQIMAVDPNNTRWTNDDSRFGTQLMKKQGWVDGQGLGRDGSGKADNVQVTRKDDVLGIGYQAGVSQTWSTQAVGFAGLLGRLNKKARMEEPSEAAEAVGGDGHRENAPTSGKHGNLYLKRRKLKTEGLTSSDGKDEILGRAAIGKRPVEDDDEKAKAEEEASTLTSATLQRAVVRVPSHEKAQQYESIVTVTKPDPRPPKATASPFRA